MKRAVVMAISVMLALIVAAPVAFGKDSSKSPSLPELTAAWWNWTSSQDPSPLEGSYEGGARCDGEYVKGVFFLAGTVGGNATRTCTVPADTPILLPVINVVCSEAYGAAGQDPPDQTPYDTACATPTTDTFLANADVLFATLDGTPLTTTRVASGLFKWKIKYYPNPFYAPAGGLPKGNWESATDGVWVYLPQGLEPGEYTLNFGGTFFEGAFGTNTTYHLLVEE